MSFGIRSLKKKEDQSQTESKRIYTRNLIVGDSTAALIALARLTLKDSNATLLTSKKITFDSLKSDWLNSPQVIRGEEQLVLAKELLPHAQLGELSPTPKFYKDTEFKVFGGRSKPFEMKDGESYFQNPSVFLNEEKVFRDKEWEILPKILEENTIHKVIVEIEHIQPTDLAEPANFKIHLSDYETLECETLIWARSPNELFKLAATKDNFSENFKNLVSKIRHKSVLKMRLALSESITTKTGDFDSTVFLPQSVTHEWGHFICDFYNSTQEEDEYKQYVNILCFVESEEVTSEDLARKIKLAKRVLERIFPDMKKVNVKEFICYDQDGLALEIDDELEIEDQNLKLIGEATPIEKKDFDVNFLLRSLKSLSVLN